MRSAGTVCPRFPRERDATSFSADVITARASVADVSESTNTDPVV
jgi:hypothetical protein